MEIFPEDPRWYDVALPFMLAGTLILSWVNGRRASVFVSICNRWLRWVTFSTAVAYLAHASGLIAKPFWVLFVASFLVWFLFDTVYHWLAIQALSKSTIPLFPHFVENPQGEEWPAQKRFLALRKWLKKNGYKSISALRAELMPGANLRMHVFQSEDDKTRIQILFVPQRSGMVSICYTILSQTVEGSRYITDNMFLPFGGFYPEDWYLDRRPLARNFQRLYQAHLKRIENTKEVFVPWEADALDDVNRQQAILERVNTEMGFLFPINLREEYGKITWEGRYRVWKEIWLLNYFGKAFSY
ncbi:MAG: hypothetical protein KJT03_00020 [Verrucomicrobiae bacterium]|nr:hypothetical protein [Verrucomicrobiae bacterium]